MLTLFSRGDVLSRGRPFGAVLDATRQLAHSDPEWASISDRLRGVDPIDPLDSIGGVSASLLQTVEASRLMGASAILTGLSSEISQTLVELGVDLFDRAVEEITRLTGKFSLPVGNGGGVSMYMRMPGS